ncbi:hypothetical protein G1K37_02200 [Tenacibaculum dicentrarchi]|nr:hypothetical protein [Tenacibaculum dicentrarchi]
MKIITIILGLSVFLSCNEAQKNKEENKELHKVVKTLYDNITKSHTRILTFPVSPPNPKIKLDYLSKKIENVKDTSRIVNSYIKKEGRLIVCIDKNLKPSIPLNKIDLKCKRSEFENLYKDFIKIERATTLDLIKIRDNKYSVILPYHDNFLKMSDKGFDKCDVALSFSRIAFNKEKKKAIVIVATSFGRLNGFSTLYFLQKEKGIWEIKCEEGLTIS